MNTSLVHKGRDRNLDEYYTRPRAATEPALLLCQAALMRPQHRGVARRYWAVRQTNPLLRQLALLISYRDLK